MKFLYPEFLFALFALAIPIVIHLFNFRRYKRVLFTNVAFLSEVNERTQASQKLKHWLVLLSRLLLLAFLVMAFAQPVVPRRDVSAVKAEKAVSVFVDNSFSMQAENTEGSLFLQALEKARTIAGTYKPTADFQLLTHSFAGNQQRFTTQEDFLEQTDAIEIVPQSRTLSEILNRQSDLLKTAEGKDQHLYIVSDFQQHMCDFDALEIDSTITVHFVPIGAGAGSNAYIDSVWFDTPFHNLNQQEQLNFSIENQSDNSAEDLPMSVFIDGAQTAIGTYSTRPYNNTDTALYFNNDSPGIRHGYIDIDDYPITYDDRYFFSYSVDSTLRVLEIGQEDSGEPSYFERIFDEDPLYDYLKVNARMIDYADLKSRHFIVLNQPDAISSGLRTALLGFVENGGSVFLVPGDAIDAESLNAFTRLFNGPVFTDVVDRETKVSTIDTEAPFFANLFDRIPKNMDLPKVLSYYKVNFPVASQGRDLMTLRSGDSFLSRMPKGTGTLYVSAVPLDTENNNFARHAIFVAAVLRMSELSRPATPPSYSLAEELAIGTGNVLPAGDEVFRIRSLEDDFEVIPEFNLMDGRGFLFIRDQINRAGNYALYLGDALVMGLAFNYPRSESEMTHFKGDQLRSELDKRGLGDIDLLQTSGDAFEASLLEVESGEKLWKLFIIIALAFAAIETLLLKFWKS